MRCMFEDKILMSDVVLLSTWVEANAHARPHVWLTCDLDFCCD